MYPRAIPGTGTRASWRPAGLCPRGLEDTGTPGRGPKSSPNPLPLEQALTGVPWIRGGGQRPQGPWAAHLQLGSDIVVLEAAGPFLSHFVVPGTENSDGMDPRSAAYPVALPKRAGHAGRSRGRQRVRWGGRRRGWEKTDGMLPAAKTYHPLRGALPALDGPPATLPAPPLAQSSQPPGVDRRPLLDQP